MSLNANQSLFINNSVLEVTYYPILAIFLEIGVIKDYHFVVEIIACLFIFML